MGFDHAVAGHDGTLSDSTGELFIKPCTAQEIAFYEQTYAEHPDLAELMPTFLGTLELSDEQTASMEEASAALLNKYTVPDGGHHAVAEPMHPKVIKTKKITTNRAIVLENAMHGYHKPNILDCKLGVRLYADNASAEKKKRFDKITEETTHKELGFRIAGMRVWQGHDEPRGGDIDRQGFRIYDKLFGREDVNVDNIVDAFRAFMFESKAGVDSELGKLVAQAFISEVEDMIKALEKVETRMFSASILFVFEGDGEALRKAMQEASNRPPRAEQSESEDEDDEEIPEPKIFSAKLIDFAHAEYVPGQGPDENSLKGVRSCLRILKELAFGEEHAGKMKSGVAETKIETVRVNGDA